jgi:predicted NBD/HSP70 family sugar kinase
VGAPGPLDAVSGTILNPPDFACWHDVPVVSGLARHLSLPVFLDNNASALALAERNLGLGSELDGFLLLVVDSGVGAGIVIHDELYRGNGGFGSEIGHTSIAMEGRPCSCGHRGCLERYAAIPEILGQLSASARPAASWEEVVDRAMEGDADCLALVDREASYLAVAIVNAMNLLELEAVVLAGAVRYRPALLLERLAPYVRERAMTRTLHRLRIESSPIDREPGIVSAAAIVIDRFFRGGSST